MVFVFGRFKQGFRFNVCKVKGNWYMGENIPMGKLKTMAMSLGMRPNGKDYNNLFKFIFGDVIKPISDLQEVNFKKKKKKKPKGEWRKI